MYVNRYQCQGCKNHVPDPYQYEPCQQCGGKDWKRKVYQRSRIHSWWQLHKMQFSYELQER